MTAREYGLLIPSKVFLTSGVGVARRKLTSFEFALREAGIERCNLVRVSSIFPPHCKLLDSALSPRSPPTNPAASWPRLSAWPSPTTPCATAT